MIPLPAQLAIVLAIAISAAAIGYSKGVQKYYNFKAHVEAQSQIIKEENEARLQAQENLHERVKTQYERTIAGLKRVPIRVLPGRGCTGESPAVPATTAGTDATGAQLTITVEQCADIANNARIDAATLTALQDWVKQTHEVSK